jgi:hypothetical protein
MRLLRHCRKGARPHLYALVRGAGPSSGGRLPRDSLPSRTTAVASAQLRAEAVAHLGEIISRWSDVIFVKDSLECTLTTQDASVPM